MIKQLLQDNSKTKLSDLQLTKEFVNITRKSIAIEKASEYLQRAIHVSKSLEDLAIIATNVEELTLEQKALLQVNGNMAVAGTEVDPSTLSSEEISQEDFKESSNGIVSNVSKEFVTIWNNLISMLTSVNEINDTLAIDTEKLINQSEEAIASCIEVVRGTLDIGNLTIAKYHDQLIEGSNPFEELAKARNLFVPQLTDEVSKAFINVKAIIQNTFSEFGSTTPKVAEEAFKQASTSLNNLLVQLGLEEVTTSFDGLITDVVIPSTDNIVSNTIEITFDSLHQVNKEAKANLEVILQSKSTIKLLLDNSTFSDVNNFGKICSLLLTDDVVHSKTKELIIEHYELFIKTSKLANDKIIFMQDIARFILAYNELLDAILKTIKPIQVE